MKMLYRNNFDLRLHSRIRSDIYRSLPEEVIASDDFDYVNDVIKEADKIYAKIDKERISKSICRLNKLFAGKEIIVISYGKKSYETEIKKGDIMPYNHFENLLKQNDDVTITEVFICKDFAKIDLIIDYGRTLSNVSFYIKEVSSEQCDSYTLQDFKSDNETFNFCLDIYKQNKGITLRRAALGSVA